MDEPERDAGVENSGCISLMDPRSSIGTWYRCLDITCMEQPSTGAAGSPGEEPPTSESAEKSAEMYLQRAEEEERKGNYRGASECYRKAARLDPRNAQIHNNFGYLCSTHTHDYSTAEYHYRLAIQCDPNYALAYNNLAFFLKKNKRDFDGAEKYYREAIRCDDKYAFAHSNLGVLLKSKRDLAGAETHYLAAIRSNPRYAPAYLNYSLLLKNYSESDSWEYLKVAMDIDPTLRESQAAQNLVRAFGKLGTDVAKDAAPNLHLQHFPRLPDLLKAKQQAKAAQNGDADAEARPSSSSQTTTTTTTTR